MIVIASPFEPKNLPVTIDDMISDVGLGEGSSGHLLFESEIEAGFFSHWFNPAESSLLLSLDEEVGPPHTLYFLIGFILIVNGCEILVHHRIALDR